MKSMLDHIRCWYCFKQLPCDCACSTNDELRDQAKVILQILMDCKDGKLNEAVRAIMTKIEIEKQKIIRRYEEKQ